MTFAELHALRQRDPAAFDPLWAALLTAQWRRHEAEGDVGDGDEGGNDDT